MAMISDPPLARRMQPPVANAPAPAPTPAQDPVMSQAASLPALTPAETVALSVERIAIALVLLFFLGAILVSDMNGYQGSDDARYIAGAEAWLAEGIHIARNHWETRLPYVLLIAATGTTAGSVLALHITLGIALILMSWRLSGEE